MEEDAVVGLEELAVCAADAAASVAAEGGAAMLSGSSTSRSSPSCGLRKRNSRMW